MVLRVTIHWHSLKDKNTLQFWQYCAFLIYFQIVNVNNSLVCQKEMSWQTLEEIGFYVYKNVYLNV